MTPDEIRLVQTSFDGAFPVYSRMTELFYEELFRIAPQVRPLFPEEMAPLRKKFVNMLASIVGMLDRPEMLASVVEDLGRRHARYGAQPVHFAPVGEALLFALGSALGDRFDAATAEAWNALFADVRRVMERGMARAA